MLVTSGRTSYVTILYLGKKIKKEIEAAIFEHKMESRMVGKPKQEKIFRK
jgi:hypothetical protein